MEVLNTKTARFTSIVQECGRPRTATLWTRPEEDSELSRAIKTRRVMTVVRANVGSKKDFGLIGLEPRPGALYLIFPKPLSGFADRRIIGINYDLISEPEVKNPVSPPRTRARQVPEHGKAAKSKAAPRRVATPEPARAAKPEPAPCKPKRYSVEVKLVLTSTQTIEVEAESRADAKAKAVEKVRPGWSEAEVRKKALGIKKL